MLGLCWGVRTIAEPVLAAVEAVESQLDARVGFVLHDLHTGTRLTHRAEERFPLASTFKLFACAALLQTVERGEHRLDDTVDLGEQPLVLWSPGVKKAREKGQSQFSLNELCRLTLAVSDNTAANSVLAAIGGPEGFTAFMRSIDDKVTRLDRWEPELNEAVPGDPRDTSSPRAIAGALEQVLLTDRLAPESRESLKTWLAGHRMADALFRSALPTDWSIEDRTGTGAYGSRAIIAVLYPPERKPLVAALYITETAASREDRDAAIARVGRAIVAHVTASP